MMPKCIDCGLLAIQDPHNQAVVEMVMRTRHDGHFTHCKGSRISAALTFCYAMSDAFPETSPKIPDNIDEWSRERECDCFMTYHIGRSPKEHDDMINREAINQLQSQMADALSGISETKKQLYRLEKHGSKKADRQIRIINRHNLTTRILTIFSLLVGGIAALTAFISMWIAIVNMN